MSCDGRSVFRRGRREVSACSIARFIVDIVCSYSVAVKCEVEELFTYPEQHTKRPYDR